MVCRRHEGRFLGCGTVRGLKYDVRVHIIDRRDEEGSSTVPGAIAELFSLCDAGVELFQHLFSFVRAGNLKELVAKTRLDVVQL